MQKGQQESATIKVVITVVGILLIAGGLFWYSQSNKEQELAPRAVEDTSSIDIGARIYEEAAVPNVIPESAPAVPNPIEGLYKNPFE